MELPLVPLVTGWGSKPRPGALIIPMSIQVANVGTSNEWVSVAQKRRQGAQAGGCSQRNAIKG